MELLRVDYQRIWFDYAVAEGTYSPAQLRKAGMVVKHAPEAETYTLMWPGGDPQPPRKEDKDWPFGDPSDIQIEL